MQTKAIIAPITGFLGKACGKAITKAFWGVKLHFQSHSANLATSTLLHSYFDHHSDLKYQSCI